jgi:hypothetical protein
MKANRAERHCGTGSSNVRRSPGEVREGIGKPAGELETDARLTRAQPTEPACRCALGSGTTLMEHQESQGECVLGAEPAELFGRGFSLGQAPPLSGAAEASEWRSVGAHTNACSHPRQPHAREVRDAVEVARETEARVDDQLDRNFLPRAP